MIDLNDANFLEKLARFVPYILTLLGFVIAIFNQRIVDLRKDEKIEEKNTRPLMDVSLGKSVQPGKISLLINASNETPFKANWLIVTENNRVVSGIFFEKLKLFPSEKKRNSCTK